MPKPLDLINRLNIIKETKKLHRIMVTGGYGQIGTSLVKPLNIIYGEENILVTDLINKNMTNNFDYLDCLDAEQFEKTFNRFKPDLLIHLPAILSGKGELKIDLALNLNINSLNNALKLCSKNNCRLFTPSTIAVYGQHIKETTKDNSPQFPNTIYGITKVYLESMGAYYKEKLNLDFRSLRYPGVMSSLEPGMGTTDYATEIFYKFVKKEKYKCYLNHDSELPFIDEEDLIAETLKFIETDPKYIKNKSYSIQGFSFTPELLYKYLKEIDPDFEISYEPDFRLNIANTWPNKMSASDAKKDWGFNTQWKEKDSILKILQQVKNKIFH